MDQSSKAFRFWVWGSRSGFLVWGLGVELIWGFGVEFWGLRFGVWGLGFGFGALLRSAAKFLVY